MMRFYASEESDGTVHVQSTIMGIIGQHHVHSKASFKKWAKSVDKTSLKVIKAETPCSCGLKPGDVREYDDTIWHNEEWEK